MSFHLFFLDPALLTSPLIALPNAYEPIEEHQDTFNYLRHAQILVDRLLARQQDLPREEERLGLNLTATLIATKWASHDEVTFGYFLSLFDLKDAISDQRFGKMERIFLKAIDYQVHVEYAALKFILKPNLWKRYSGSPKHVMLFQTFI